MLFTGKIKILKINNIYLSFYPFIRQICLLKMILVSIDVTVYCRVIPSNSLRIKR